MSAQAKQTPAERAAAIAQKAANRIEANIAREWWRITEPIAEPKEVFFCPAQTQAEVLARYPNAGVLPL